jgi:hypothetical protein
MVLLSFDSWNDQANRRAFKKTYSDLIAEARKNPIQVPPHQPLQKICLTPWSYYIAPILEQRKGTATKKKGRVGSDERWDFIDNERVMTDEIRRGLDAGINYPTQVIFLLEVCGLQDAAFYVVYESDYMGWSFSDDIPPIICLEFIDRFDCWDEIGSQYIVKNDYIDDEVLDILRDRKKAAEDNCRLKAEVAGKKDQWKRLREEVAKEKFEAAAEKRRQKFNTTKLGRQLAEQK